MPVVKVKGGYRWGKKGKVYKTKAEAANNVKASPAKSASKRKDIRKARKLERKEKWQKAVEAPKGFHWMKSGASLN